MNDFINFSNGYVKVEYKEISTLKPMILSTEISWYSELPCCQCSPLRKHSPISPKKDFYTIITTAPSPFIFIVNIKGKRQCIRAHFGSRGEAISTVAQRESKTAFIL